MVKKLLLFPIALLVGLFLGSVTKEAYAQIMQLSDGTYGHKIVIYNLDGTAVSSFGGGTPGGADTQVQYNDAGAFNGDAGLTWNETTNQLTFTAGTTTTSAPPISITQTWNDAGVTFVAQSVSITSTASAAASALWRGTLGGTNIAEIRRDGCFYAGIPGVGVFSAAYCSDSNGFPVLASPQLNSKVKLQRLTTTVDGATTFSAGTTYTVLECTGAETINTITDGVSGMLLYIEHTDTDCTIADDDDATASNAVDLTGTATDDVGAVNKMILLVYNGSYWMQVSESDN